MAYFLGRLASGEKVYDRLHDPYIKTDPEKLPIIQESLSQIYAVDGQDYLAVTISFDRIVGLDYCVEISPQQKEHIYYAQMQGKKGYSRFVSGIEPVPTCRLTLIFGKRIRPKKKGYNLIVARPGEQFLPEPWKRMVIEKFSMENPDFEKEVWKFWKGHAFVEGYKPIVASTKTDKLPWQSPYNRRGARF